MRRRSAAVGRIAMPLAVPGLVLVLIATVGDRLAAELREGFRLLGPVRVLEVLAAGIAVWAAHSLLPPRPRRRVRRVGDRIAVRALRALDTPAAVALPAIVAVAAGYRIVLGRAESLPRVLGDQLVYTGLAKGYALDGIPRLRGELEVGYSLVYPLLLSPAFALAETGAHALEVTKAINAIVMASTAIPVYFLARRTVSHRWSLGVAAGSVSVPWTAYTALNLTESLFYPAFAAFVVVFARALEQPSRSRQAVLVASLGVLVGIRPQALAIGVAVVAGIGLEGCRRGALRSTLRRFAWTLLALGGSVAAALAAAGAGFPVPTGSYSPVFHSLDEVVGIGKWAVWSLGAFELSLGVVIVLAFPLGVARLLRRGATDREAATGIAVLLSTVAILLSVVLLSASTYGLGVLHERSLFYVTPLVLVGGARWLADGRPRPRSATLALAILGVAFVAALPERIVLASNNVDAPSVTFFQQLDEQIPSVPLSAWAVVLASAGAGALLLVRGAAGVVSTVVVAFAAVTASTDYTGPLSRDQARALGWVDGSLPDSATATIVHVGFPRYGPCGEGVEYEQQGFVVWTEYFNARVDRVVHIAKDVQRANLASPEVVVAGGGLVVQEGTPFQDDYVVIDSRQPVVGSRLANLSLADLGTELQEGSALTLWRIEPPLRFLAHAQPLPERPDGRRC